MTPKLVEALIRTVLMDPAVREKLSDCLGLSQESFDARFSPEILDDFIQQGGIIQAGNTFMSELLRLCETFISHPEKTPVDTPAADSAVMIPPSAPIPPPPAWSGITEDSTPAMPENPPLPDSSNAPPRSPSDGATPVGAIPVDQSPTVPPSPKVFFAVDKNARVGEAFRAGIRAADGQPIEILDVIVPENLGLTYDREQGQLHGLPAAAGDYVLGIRYRFPEHFGSERPDLEGGCTLIVNPDPRALWKELPSDRNAPDWKPDTDQRYLLGENGVKLVAASKRGRSHAHVGGFREDDFFLETTAGWHILAVADGAGSASRSRHGSKIAASRAGEFIKAQLSGDEGRCLEEAAAAWHSEPTAPQAARKALYPILGGAVFTAVKAIEEEANGKGHPVKDYATTLILGIHKPIASGHLIAAYWVGDGAVAVYRQGNPATALLLGEVDSGEFAGQTRFLDRSTVASGEGIMQRIRLTLIPDFTALILMTDGISDPKFETDRNLADARYWDRLWQEISPLLDSDRPDDRLLGWLDFWSQGNHDDRTIALLLK
jgi:hypothetical protein